jgi:hypothetical protein
MPQKAYLQYLQKLNAEHLASRPHESELAARMSTFDLAEAMQTSAKEALDIHKETEATHRMYGLDQEATREYGTRCLIARRLVERGVRFVQLYTSTQQWDHHGSIVTALPASCKKIDQPATALVKDLSTWLAGGGVREGCIHGETDDFGYQAVKDIVNHFDYHATILYLFGLDPQRLSFVRPGGNGTLLDGQPGRIVNAILKKPSVSV